MSIQGVRKGELVCRSLLRGRMAGVKARGSALDKRIVEVHPHRGAPSAFMVNVPLVWDVLCIGLQGRVIAPLL